MCISSSNSSIAIFNCFGARRSARSMVSRSLNTAHAARNSISGAVLYSRERVSSAERMSFFNPITRT